MDLIERQTATQTALEFIVEYLGGAFDEDFQKKLMERMNSLPSAQPDVTDTNVGDTIWKKGKWVEMPDDIFAPIVVCSRCNQLAIVDLYGEYQRTRYCPHCGCEMERKSDGFDCETDGNR